MVLKKLGIEKLQLFEKNLNPQKPEMNAFKARIIGYGEMSTVLNFDYPDLSGLAFKRMPLFRNMDEICKYESNYKEYNNTLIKLGIKIPKYGSVSIKGRNNNMVLYLFQELLPDYCIANKIIHNINVKHSILIFKEILNILSSIHKHNLKARQNSNLIELGFDVQLSNWAVRNYNPDANIIQDDISLLFFDTGTPLMKKVGIEQIDPELFLRICPSSLVWIIRRFFLKDVLSRYYDLRLIIIDLIANLYKEKKEQLIESFINVGNDYLIRNWPDILPITGKEIRNYYREDALIWKLFLAFRKMERFIQTKMGKPYEIILPEKIER